MHNLYSLDKNIQGNKQNTVINYFIFDRSLYRLSQIKLNKARL